MKLTDGEKTVEIEMYDWDFFAKREYEFSANFFEGLSEQDKSGAYIVDDVDYCIDYAKDWENRQGDFYGESDKPSRTVIVTFC